MTPFRIYLAAYRHNEAACNRAVNDVTGAELAEACSRAEIALARLQSIREAFGR